MSLLVVPEHTEADLSTWRDQEARDLVWSQRERVSQLAARSLEAIEGFAREGCYASVSWGKDSTVLAHLCWAAREECGVCIPLGWVRCEPNANPWCHLVRDAFLDRWRSDYREIEVRQWEGEDGLLHSSGTIEQGFRSLEVEFGVRRYMSGVRGDESAARMIRVRQGLELGRTCAPLAWWTEADVFAWLALHDLPVHPVYAMTMGGRWPRELLRVASIGEEHGIGRGRQDWEARYASSRP